MSEEKKQEPKPVTLEPTEKDAVIESIREQQYKLRKEIQHHQHEAYIRQDKMRLLDRAVDRLTGRI